MDKTVVDIKKNEQFSNEDNFKKVALTYLHNHPKVGWCFHTDTDRVRHRKYRNGRKGILDVIGYLTNGKFFAIELKSKEGKESPEQADFIIRAKGYKIPCGIASTIDEIDQILNEKING